LCDNRRTILAIEDVIGLRQENRGEVDWWGVRTVIEEQSKNLTVLPAWLLEKTHHEMSVDDVTQQ
jgi:hypothetical protein